MNASLHLLPVGLGESEPQLWLPEGARAQAAALRYIIAENAKTARAFLKLVGTQHALQEIVVHTLTTNTPETELQQWLTPLANGTDVGLVSEAGCPAVADPGARVVALAHRLGLAVRPWAGPSSLLLGLMASGLEGQRFTFHGYAPVRPDERASALQRWEHDSARHNQTQILIETPYRNAAMFGTLLQCLQPHTQLCVARALTTPQEWVQTRTIAQWRNQPAPALDKLPTVFLFLAESRAKSAQPSAAPAHPGKSGRKPNPARGAAPGQHARRPAAR